MKIEYIPSTTPYLEALKQQEQQVEWVEKGTEEETLFLVEHPAIYTSGTSANLERDLKEHDNIPLIQTGRGGQITYHGPGQRVVYPILDLRKRGRDLRSYVEKLQNVIIETLAEFGINAYTTDDVGVWVQTPSGEDKIAAIGIRVRKWVTFHGFALNIHPDLSHYKGIVPCGITDKGVTSMKALGVQASMAEVDKILIEKLNKQFPE